MSLRDMNEPKNEIVFRAYNKNGFKSASFSLPNEDFKVKIYSNFCFGNSSYLYAEIFRDGNVLLDSSVEKIPIFDHSGLRKFSVPSEDWHSLFEKIIKAYRISKVNEICQGLLGYLYEMSMILHSDRVYVKRAMHQKKSMLGEKTEIIKLITQKLEDFISTMDDIELDNKEILDVCLQLCDELCYSIKHELNYNELTDNEQNQLSTQLLNILNFLDENGGGLKILQLFIEN